MNLTPEPLSNQRCEVGENPLWNPDDGRVYWTDIPRGVLYAFDPKNSATETVYRGDPVGGFTLQADGRLLLFRVRDVATLDVRSGEVRVVAAVDDDTIERFNDVHADPQGRVYAGTIGRGWKKVGGLYRFDLDGRWTKLFAGTACSNGMAFTPDERHLYWTDTTARTIYKFRRDAATGELSGRAEFYRVPDAEGHPDGMAMDRDGNLWSARWGGARLVVISPYGKKLDEVPMPVPAVSSAAFGGPAGDELFVTTAEGHKREAPTAAGTLYRLRTNTTGRPTYRSRVGL